MNFRKNLSIVVCAFAAATFTTTVSAQAAPDRDHAVGAAWSIRDVLARVQRMDPRLRVKAAERLTAQIAQRRAAWDRVQGRIGLHAGHQVTSTGWLATEQIAHRTDDEVTGAAYDDIRLPLYAGGRISAALDAADAQLRGARHDEALLRLQLSSTALIAYAEALAAEDTTRVAEKALSRAHELVRMTQKKKTAGIDTEADVARAELNLVRYEEDVTLARGARQMAMTTLRAVLLLDTSAPLALAGSLSEVASITGRQPGPHPELAVARAALDQARAEQHVAEADYLPSVELFATGQYGNTLPGAPTTPMYQQRFGPLSGSAAAGVRAGWTVFDFFATRDRVATAESVVAARRAEQDVTAVMLRKQRDEAARREQSAAARLRVLASGGQVAERALRLARARYETGNATLTEVLDAELEAIRLETNRVQAGLQLALAHVDRLYAEGIQP